MKASVESPSNARSPFVGGLTQVGQAVLFVLVWLIASALVHALALPISAGVVGLFIVLILLFSGVINVRWIKSGAGWMLGELMLFFIPCVVAVIKYSDLFHKEGGQIVIAIAVGTILVMVATALSVRGGCRIENWLARRNSLSQHTGSVNVTGRKP